MRILSSRIVLCTSFWTWKYTHFPVYYTDIYISQNFLSYPSHHKSKKQNLQFHKIVIIFWKILTLNSLNSLFTKSIFVPLSCHYVATKKSKKLITKQNNIATQTSCWFNFFKYPLHTHHHIYICFYKISDIDLLYRGNNRKNEKVFVNISGGII